MIFGLVSKVVGAIYRIPLTSIIGAEGMGLYQMVFPLYTLMLTLSSSGIPSSISKLISESVAKNNYKQAKRILKVSFLLLVCFSLFCTIIVFVFAGVFAGLQGNISAKICYYGLAPAIILVGVIAGFRGYFQGLQCMMPSAVSGFIEQAVKMGFGLFFASIMVKKGIVYGVLGALIGISVSELVALVYLLITYIVKKAKMPKDLFVYGEVLNYKNTAKKILSLSFFITLGGLIMPLTMLIDSGVVINILKSLGYSKSYATELFGLQTGTVGSIINMPVILSLSISTAILPYVSSRFSKGDFDGAKKSASKAILIAIIFALPASVGLFTFSKEVVVLLYGRGLTKGQILISANLLEIASVGVFYLSLLQVSSGILQGIGKFKIPLISLAVGATIKMVLNLVLISVPSINIMGAEFSTVVCYMVALFINLGLLKKYKMLTLDHKIFVVMFLSLAIYFSKYLFQYFVSIMNYFIAFFTTITIVVVIYFFFVFILYKRSLFLCKKIKNNEKKV